MYFDNLTLISLLVFLVAFGAFVYSCLFRNCISNTKDTAWRRDESGEEDQR